MPFSRSTRILVFAIAAAVLLAVGWFVFANLHSSEPHADERDGVPQSLLPDSTEMGVVELEVANLAPMRDYYEHAVGLQVLSETEDTVELGLDVPLISLRTGGDTGSSTEQSGGEVGTREAVATPSEAGLYHSAILYPDEAALARALLNVAQTAPNSYEGSADHLVSLAFYFADPEGNGLELYVDRPAEEWEWQNGEVVMGSYALDPNAFIDEHLGANAAGGQVPDELPSSAVMGHVHMKVGDLQAAEAFYADALGFAVTARSDGAIFYSAAGYHHHLATNTWLSEGAGVRENRTGLGSLTVTVGDTQEVTAVGDRLDAAGIAYERHDGGIVVHDPWGNEIRIELG